LAIRLKLLHILLYHKWHFLALLCTKIENQQALITQGPSNGYANIDWKQVGTDTLIGFATGVITGIVAGGIFGGIKYKVDPKKIANIMSGLSKAENSFDDISGVVGRSSNGLFKNVNAKAIGKMFLASAKLDLANASYDLLSKLSVAAYEILEYGTGELLGLIF
jgi:hypothetical protein